jgi:hypothetical protein
MGRGQILISVVLLLLRGAAYMRNSPKEGAAVQDLGRMHIDGTVVLAGVCDAREKDVGVRLWSATV